MLFLVRTLESLLCPIGLLWACLTVAGILCWRKKARRAAGFCFLLDAFLYLAGATPIPRLLIARLERPFANPTIANALAADVVIVLGGNADPSPYDTFKLSLNSSADRIVTGVELMRRKKAQTLIVSGGAATISEDLVSEGQRVENWLRTWDVVPGEIIALPACVNTHDEALHARDVMALHHWTNAIIVTSAYHMRRALATFQKEGITARPVACDFEGLPVADGEMAGWRIVPVIERLKTLTLYMHEIFGWVYYAARGWI